MARKSHKIAYRRKRTIEPDLQPEKISLSAVFWTV